MDDPILTTVSAAAVAAILTNLFKLAWAAAPSWALVAVAVAAGVGSSILVSVANGATLDAQAIAGMAVQGLIAAAGAAGIDQTSQRANIQRRAVRREAAQP